MAETRYDLEALLANWRWLIDPREYVLLAVSPFGDLFLQDRSGTFTASSNMSRMARKSS